jgi:hypothetical protein
VRALEHGLFPEPAHIVEQDLLVVFTFVNVGDATMLDKRINRSPILADALGIKASGFAILKVFLGSRSQRDPARAARQNDRALRAALCAEPLEFVERQLLLAP